MKGREEMITSITSLNYQWRRGHRLGSSPSFVLVGNVTRDPWNFSPATVRVHCVKMISKKAIIRNFASLTIISIAIVVYFATPLVGIVFPVTDPVDPYRRGPKNVHGSECEKMLS